MFQAVRLRYALFIAFEIIIFALFFGSYLIGQEFLYYLYLGLTPFFLLILIYLRGDLKKNLSRLILSRDLIILLVVITAWFYLYAVYRDSLSYLAVVLYVPVLLEELNFRYVIITYLAPIFRGGMAVIIQAVLYVAFYSIVLITYPAGYPGILSEFFLMDMFSIGLIYGSIYFLRKNIYIDMAIHFSLWAMIPFTPAWLIWLPYSMAPA
ncbi:MAG: hypothetical protein B2I17_06975 [Thermoplasmatales archaeon B_DKE]|nr:MAG: hypothetical protein B2I17_06975 [Thermoplasmatales archaeon B_DKE]